MPPSEPDPGPSLDVIPREECLALLRSVEVGRIAVAPPDGAPHVVPVNYVVEGEAVVFRSESGTKERWMRDRPVSFQVDLIDVAHRTGWSVLVQGAAEVVAPTVGDPVALDPWAPGHKPHRVRLPIDSVTGRRIRLGSPETDGRAYL